MGRYPKPGTVYYLGRIRYDPGEDPPELKEILETIAASPPDQRPAIIKAALLEGRLAAQAEASKDEDQLETEALLNDLFS